MGTTKRPWFRSLKLLLNSGTIGFYAIRHLSRESKTVRPSSSNPLRSICVALLLATATTTSAVAADPYPVRPVRIIVNTGPGGLVDIVARLIAQKMSESLKQPVIVENRAGGDGLIGIRYVKAAPADGYTLLASASTMAFQIAVKADPGFELKDFAGIGLLGRSPFLLVEAPSKSDKTLADLIARVRANPGRLSYASAGVGTTTHFAAANFLQQAGADMVHVPYKGNGPAMPDVLSGRVEMIFETYGSSRNHVKGGSLRALGITSPNRLADLPDVPTFIEQGFTNFTAYTWMYLLAPTGVPLDAVQRLSAALANAEASPEVKARFREDGVDAPEMSPQQVNGSLVRHTADAARLMKDLGISKQ